MRILITNNALSHRAGTELYVRDIALGLRRHGLEPICFSLNLGEVAEELQAHGIQVVTHLRRDIGPLDVIHGQHRFETTLAGMAFPTAPIISWCHGPLAWQESPCTLPNVVQYAAVDEACRQRLVDEGIEPSRIQIMLNFADTARFQPREPLPAKPRRALIFSNYARESTHLPVVREACEACGIPLDVVGRGVGTEVAHPETVLPQYDLVFAKARAAIEAMAVGCAVIQCDHFGAGRLVSPAIFDELRPLNFGYKSMTYPLTAEHLVSQIQLYDPRDAAEVSLRIRQEASLEATLPRLIALYEAARAQPVPAFDPWEAAAPWLASEVGFMKRGREVEQLEKIRQEQAARITTALAETEQERARAEGLVTKLDGVRQENRELLVELEKLRSIPPPLQPTAANQHHAPHPPRWWRKIFGS